MGFEACDSPELLCAWSAAGRGDPASFPLPHGLCVPAASCAAAGSVSSVIRIPWCLGSQAGLHRVLLLVFNSLGQHSLCQPQGTQCRRELSLLGAAWEAGWALCAGNTPWLCPGAACSEHSKVRCLGDRGRSSAWVPQFGRILLPGIAQWGDRLLEGGLASVSFLK